MFFKHPLFLASLLFLSASAQPGPVKQGAALLKTDIMSVFAHPDDETGMAGTLAYYALGKGAICANVYCTRGEGGGNMVGTQWGDSLGILREAELRQCLNTIGVRYCYFLNQPDWAYTESAAATLQKWGHEQTLERLVRFVRALRPEIIVTMNPAPTPGQHGHHQTAGILATEAFAAAADPARFPEQLSREGLTVWQPRKLYYGGSNTTQVAVIKLDQANPDGRFPGEIAAAAMINHRSQGFGNFGNSSWLKRPQTFTLVKSFVTVSPPENDLLSGLPIADDRLALVSFAPSQRTDPIEFTFVPRPAFQEYQHWVKINGIEQVVKRYAVDLPLLAGKPNIVHLEVKNGSNQELKGDIHLDGPSGWQISPVICPMRIAPGTAKSVPVTITPPTDSRVDVDFHATLHSTTGNFETTAHGHLLPFGRISRVAKVPALNGTEEGWEGVGQFRIASTNLAEGKTSSDADSSAVFRLAHDKTKLYVDVLVKDDHIVSNIAPNDIRGHWRSDSVEICIDPAAGAAHTLGCYKIGIFPFDTTGVVRAARDADANQGPIEQTAPGTRLLSARTSDGYRIQAAIPFEEIGCKYAKGRMLGFNIIIYDGDKAGAALGENINKSRIAWSPRPGVQGRPEDWGRVVLE